MTLNHTVVEVDAVAAPHPETWKWGGARPPPWSRGTAADLQPSHRKYTQHPWRNKQLWVNNIYLQWKWQVLKKKTSGSWTTGGTLCPFFLKKKTGRQSKRISPHVDLRGVLRGPQQNIRRSVPEGHHLVGVGFGRNGLCPRQTCGIEPTVSNRLPSRNTALTNKRGKENRDVPQLLSPKSASLSSPFSLMRRFWGFRSLWRTFLLWQYDSPRRIWNRKICRDGHSN